jgi:hypothetical protein
MKPVILFRKEFNFDKEMEIASEFFDVYQYRNSIPENSKVIGRYSCLPYYSELINDLSFKNSNLINDLFNHQYIANFDYYYDIQKYTFPTWFQMSDIPSSKHHKAFVVKGRTNSRKFQWKTHMFAENFKAAVNLSFELSNDPFIGPQGLIFREYIPLETFEIGVNDIPMTNEWRLFFYKNQLITYGYYWGIIDDTSFIDRAMPDFKENGLPFAQKISEIISENTNFFVLDIAKTKNGTWIVIEINDAQQSGLNGTIQPKELYSNLAKINF